MEARYNKFSTFLKERYGEKVWKISLDAGFSCPNRNENGKEGCIFCRNDSFSQSEEIRRQKIKDQVLRGISYANERLKIKKYIAYFQASTNTFAPASTLRQVYEQALAFDNVIGISISTRPDCLSMSALAVIADLAQKTDVWVELGLQSSHDDTLKLLNRGHSYADFVHAVNKLKDLPVRICAHIMFGLPGEESNHSIETARKIAKLPIHEVKLHPLLILKDTELEKLYLEEKVSALELQDYAIQVVDFIELLPGEFIIQRLTAEAPKSILVAPLWALNKLRVLNSIEKEFMRRDTFQGAMFKG